MSGFIKQRLIVMAAVAVLAAGAIGSLLVRALLGAAAPAISLREPFASAPGAPPPFTPAESAAVKAAPLRPEPTGPVVDIIGAVKRPGVYRLKPDALVIDGLRAAGGARGDANTDAVNLAAQVQPNSQLYFPSQQQTKERHAPEAVSAAAAPGDSQPAPYAAQTTSTPARIRRGGSRRSGRTAKLRDPSEGRIDLNSATAEELQRVPGVGPSMAGRIVSFRETNHGFSSTDDLRRVGGIGAKKFARMSPFFTVGAK